MDQILKIHLIFGILSQLNAQFGRRLGDECIPGYCNAINSNCKWNGTLFKCVCREKFLLVNQTHCGKPLASVEELKCQECMFKDSLCLDYDNDGYTDECWSPKTENLPQNKQTTKNYQNKNLSEKETLKNVNLEMQLIDLSNNRNILNGSTVFFGDQVLIDIKSSSQNVLIGIENCTVSSNANIDNRLIENIEMIKKGCQANNDINLNFRSISDTHLESNLFEIFKFKESPFLSITCWLKICQANSECLQHLCAETASLSYSKIVDIFDGKKSLVSRSLTTTNEEGSSKEMSLFKQSSIRLIVEDPYGLSQKIDKNKNQQLLPNSVELEFKTKPFSGVVKSSIVSAVAIIFGIIVSILSILVYRACYRNNGFNTTDLSGPFSVYQTSQSCKYDMNARNDESFFRNHVEPVHTKSYGHSDRW